MKAVILAGGTGTRLWPLSRKNQPKQFQSLASKNTLFQEAIDRLNFLAPTDIYVATNEEFVDMVKIQAPNLPHEQIIVEPALRDTASCIALAAAIVGKKHPNEVMVIIYADHLIKGMEEFEKKLKISEQVVQNENSINIIEVNAKFPNVNLGYVKVTEKLDTIDDVEIFGFERFVEKPDLETAKEFQKDGGYLWNTGIYMWKISTILEAYKTHLPDTYERVMKIQKAYGTDKQDIVTREEYPLCEKISIDYAIMEKINPSQVRIIPGDLGWSDIGTWLSLHEELAQSPTDNISKGEVMEIDCEGSILYNYDDSKLVVGLGVKDLAIINTPDGILICDKNRSQDVKKIVQKLKEQSKNELL
jgi:mannose-1-phosphate guanylyltransferase